MATIVPAILADSLDEYETRSSELLKIPEVERIQVDFSDGQFTPRRTVQPGELDLLNPAYHWEAHLMVTNPQQYFFDCKLAGFNTIIFHYEACADLSQIKKYAEELKNYKIAAGLAVNSSTPIEKIADCAEFFDQITLLTVEPGYSGQEMDTQTPRRLNFLKNQAKNAKIEIDGGVNLSNAKGLVQAGADLLIVNSALYKVEPQVPDQELETSSEIVPNLIKNFEKLQSEISSL